MSSRKKHIVTGMKKTLLQRLAELETNEQELIEHVRNISQETTCQVRGLLQETDKKKFLKTFPNVSFKLDKSLTALMMMKASLPSLESDDSSTDSASEDNTAGSQTCDTQTLGDKTDGSVTETDHSAHQGVESEFASHGPVSEPRDRDSSALQQKVLDVETESHTSGSSPPSYVSSQPSSSPCKQPVSSSSFSSETLQPASRAGGATLPHISAEDLAAVAPNVAPFPAAPVVPVKHQETTQDKSVSSRAGPVPVMQTSSTPREIFQLVLPVGIKVKTVISEVVSPSIFWIQQMQSRIEALMEEIKTFYNNSDLKLPAIQPKVGMFCCACFTTDDCWYRARIIAIHLSPCTVMEGISVDVIYVDYGNRERIPVSRLRPLHPRFMTDPAQAVCCRLARVKPSGKASAHWSKEETDFFTKVTVGKELTALVVRQPGSCSSLDLPAIDLLFDHYINENETRLVDVARLMASQNQALPDDQAYDTPATDPDHSQTTHTTDSEQGQSQNALQATTPSASAKGAENDDAKQRETPKNQEQNVNRDVESSSGRKKKKKKTKKSKRSHEPLLSTEDTDVPENDQSQRDAPNLAKDKGGKENSSDTPVYESEYTTEKRVPSFCCTPETSCTETESQSDKQVVATGNVRASPVPLTSREKVPASKDNFATGGDMRMEKVGQGCKLDHRASCGSESPRSSSPNSTSGVSSAMSSMYVAPSIKDAAKPVSCSSRREPNESLNASSQQVNSSENTKDKPSDVETTIESLKKSKTFRAPSIESDHLTEQFYTCAEDASGTESTDRETAKPHAKELLKPPGVVTKVKEIGNKYVRQRAVQAGELIQFAMSHIVSPQEFYAHLITPDAQKMDYLLDELNDVYSDIERAGTYAPPRQWLSNGCICCAKFCEDNRWYRGVVKDIRGVLGSPEMRQALVKYVDFGNEEWIPGDAVFPLERYFCALPPLAFQCAMSRLQPPSNNDTEQLAGEKQGGACEWPQESIRALTEMSQFEKLLTGRIIQADCSTGFSVLELEVTDNSDGDLLCVNQRLVDLEMASSLYYKKQPLSTEGPNRLTSPQAGEVGAGDDGILSRENPARSGTQGREGEGRSEIPDDWNPMGQHFSSEVNSYGVDMDDPGVATTGLKSTIEGRVCRFYAVGKRCYKGFNCPFEHPRPGRDPLEQTRAFWCNTTVSLPRAGDWVSLEVTAVHTPVHFWAQLPFGPKCLGRVQREWATAAGTHRDQLQPEEERKDDGETLNALQDSINEIYQKPYVRHEDLSLLALGETVCAQFTKDSSWYRARVVDVDAEANKVQVFYVDYGDCEWLPRARVRPAMPQFLHLPFQAVECFLKGVELTAQTPRQGHKEEDGARKLFEELTIGKFLVANVISSDADTLCVELYDTVSSKQVNIGGALASAGFARLLKSQEQKKSNIDGPGKISKRKVDGK